MEGPTIHEKKIKKQNEGKKLIKTRNQILIPNEDPRRKCDQSFFFPSRKLVHGMELWV